MNQKLNVIQLHSKTTGIIDTNELMLAMVGDIEKSNAIVYNSMLEEIIISNNYFLVKISNEDRFLKVKNIINSAGLYSREIALKIKGLNKDTIPRIKLVKGDYFKIQNKKPFNRLIYPLPKNMVWVYIQH